jgi:putative ABC transport system permease protein
MARSPRLYLGQVAFLALLALAVGVPPGLWVGHAQAEFSAGILNADLGSRPFPIAVVVAMIAIGLIVPLVTALWPVWRARAISVREALSDAPGAGPERPAPRRRRQRFDWVPPAAALWLRGTFRWRGRVALTVLLMAIGGATFLAAMNVAAAWTRSVDESFRRQHYDVVVGLATPHSIAALDAVVASVPAVTHAEYWSGASPYLIGPNGVPGTTITVLGIAARIAACSTFDVTAGRWLEPRTARERDQSRDTGPPSWARRWRQRAGAAGRTRRRVRDRRRGRRAGADADALTRSAPRCWR